MGSKNIKNEVGKRYGLLTVMAFAGVHKKYAQWYCHCDCGGSIITRGSSLRDSLTKSCGCLAGEKNRLKFATHGMSSHYLYSTYRSMISRCYSDKDPNVQHYKHRGIGVFSPWREDIRLFMGYVDSVLGPRPTGCSLDRIDNNSNYEPGNLRWATTAEQLLNTRRSVSAQDKETVVSLFASGKTRKEIADITGRSFSSVSYILKSNKK